MQMQPIKLSGTIPQTLSNSVTQQPTAINQARAKEKLAELKQLYNQYGSQSEQYLNALNAANEQFGYYSQYNIDPNQDLIQQIAQRDYSHDEPFQLMQSNPQLLQQRYESGYYKDYYTANPYAKDLIDQWYNDTVVKGQESNVLQTLSAISQKAKEYGRYSKQGFDVSPLTSEISSIQSQAAAQAADKASQLATARQQESDYYSAEQQKLSGMWSQFDTALGNFQMTGDYVQQSEELNTFVNANLDLIQGSAKNYQKYQSLSAPINDPTQYALNYLNNPNYEKIVQGDTTIIQEKPQQYLTESDWEKWQTETTNKQGKPVYHTQTWSDSQMGNFIGHELILKNGQLVEEKIINPYIQQEDRSVLSVWKKGDTMTQNDILFQNNKLWQQSKFGTYDDITKTQFQYDWSGKTQTGWDTFRYTHPYQSIFSDFIAGTGWTMDAPRGEREVKILQREPTVTESKAQTWVSKDVTQPYFGQEVFQNAKGQIQALTVSVPKQSTMPQQSQSKMPQSTAYPVFPGLNQPKPQNQSIFLGVQNYIKKQSKSVSKSVIPKPYMTSNRNPFMSL